MGVDKRRSMKKIIEKSSKGRTDGFEPSNLGSSPSFSVEEKLWSRLASLYKKKRLEEIRTIDGYKTSFEISSENNFFPGSSDYKLREDYLNYTRLVYKQILDEIEDVVQKLNIFIKARLKKAGREA